MWDPQANAIAEGLVGTFPREGVDHIIHWEYVGYDNSTRPHWTLALESPHGPRPVQRDGKVVSIPVLGGIHHRYERKAA